MSVAVPSEVTKIIAHRCIQCVFGVDVLAAAADMAASMECHNSMMEAFRNHDDEAGVSPDLDDSDVVEPFADLMLKAACNHVKASLFMALH